MIALVVSTPDEAATHVLRREKGSANSVQVTIAAAARRRKRDHARDVRTPSAQGVVDVGHELGRGSPEDRTEALDAYRADLLGQGFGRDAQPGCVIWKQAPDREHRAMFAGDRNDRDDTSECAAAPKPPRSRCRTSRCDPVRRRCGH